MNIYSSKEIIIMQSLKTLVLHSVHKKAKKNLHTPESIISLNYTHKSLQQQFVWVGAHACNKYTKFEFDWRTTRKYNLSWFLITPVA